MENMAVTAAPQADFWRGKSVLVTGHSGFKGSWLTLALHRRGAKVTGISLPPLTTPDLFTEAKIADLCRSRFLDIRDAAGLASLIRAENHRQSLERRHREILRPVLYTTERSLGLRDAERRIDLIATGKFA